MTPKKKPPAANPIVLPNKLAALTPQTLADKHALRIELANVRQQGRAQPWEELEVGLAAIGAPIHGRDGNVIAAVSVSGPTVRIDPSQIKTLAILVMDTGRRISRDVGFTRR